VLSVGISQPSPHLDEASLLSLPVHELVVQQELRTPHAVALAWAGEQLTYEQLGRRSNQVAHALIAAGVVPGDNVAVQLERSLDLPIALLGILKAGAAYVPIDPQAPAGRRDFILAETGARMLVTHSTVQVPAAPPRFDIDRTPAWNALPSTSPEVGTTAGDLMYVLYTSGTTGRPKGVMLEHAGVANVLSWMVRAYGFSPADRVLYKTPYTFDASVWELFVPLISGGTVVLARPGDHRDPRRLAETMAAEAVTAVQLVPPMLRHLLAEPVLADCRALRQVFVGGETLPPQVRDAFFARLSLPLHNLYGPTETSIQALTWTCRPGDDQSYVPIGRPIDNVTAHVLDEAGQPVPTGTSGELHLGGIALARGYLGRPELTARAFRTGLDPHAPSTRLYRTGDLVRRHPDGTFEFLGRTDHQVKIQGFRVELGEIEEQLRRIPQVNDAAVLTEQSAATGSTRLVAYLEAPALRPPVRELRARLAEQLPGYMIPAEFRATDRFPLTAHGKLDRAALPRLSAAALPPEPPEPTQSSGRGPRTDLERTLATVWSQTLGHPSVGITDDFFEIGGDSIAGLLIMARAREHGIDIPARLLFGLRRIDAIAARLSEPAVAPTAEQHAEV